VHLQNYSPSSSWLSMPTFQQATNIYFQRYRSSDASSNFISAAFRLLNNLFLKLQMSCKKMHAHSKNIFLELPMPFRHVLHSRHSYVSLIWILQMRIVSRVHVEVVSISLSHVGCSDTKRQEFCINAFHMFVSRS
jgi:hypothetical protein